MQFSEMSDYDLVIAYQGYEIGNSMKGKALGILYNRYLPAIHKHANSVFRKFQDKAHYKEDYIQDAYFAVAEAADKTEPNRIGNKDTWLFGHLLWFKLKNLSLSYRTYFMRYEGKQEPYYMDLDNGEDVQVVERTHVAWNHYIPSQKECNLELESLLSQLTEQKQAIVRMRMEGLAKQDIAHALGRTPQLVTYEMKKIKEKAEQVFDVALT